MENVFSLFVFTGLVCLAYSLVFFYKKLNLGSKKSTAHKSSSFCSVHSDLPGETQCAICEIFFCHNCIETHQSLHFCHNHLSLILNNSWKEVVTINTSSENSEIGVELYQLKKELFEKKSIPTYIEVSYQINEKLNFIETKLIIYAQEGSEDFVRKEIEKIIKLS